MTNQMEMSFPEPKSPSQMQEELVNAARQKYGIFNKPLMQQEDEKWYTTDFDGTWIEVEEYNKKMEELESLDKGDRRDLK